LKVIRQLEFLMSVSSEEHSMLSSLRAISATQTTTHFNCILHYWIYISYFIV